ncbi:MAG: FeoB-associated Cys-rich membrane protein [Prevotella sp.]|nr:FeoB-associated Cys-rich membrane protein [Prevotella sp.]
MIQFAIIALVVALSVAYVVHRVRKAAESAGDCGCGCEGCPKKEGCGNREV